MPGSATSYFLLILLLATNKIAIAATASKPGISIFVLDLFVVIAGVGTNSLKGSDT